MSLINKLIDTIYNIATGSKKIRLILAPLGAILFIVIVLLLFIVLPIQLDGILNLPQFLNQTYRIVVSIPLCATGTFLWLWSLIHFLRVRGTPVPLSPPPTLVTTGPYAHVRNPMLTGVFILMIGFGILVGSISITFIAAPCFIVLSTFELKMIEEPELEKRLGKEYVEYKKKVPMFIPRIQTQRYQSNV